MKRMGAKEDQPKAEPLNLGVENLVFSGHCLQQPRKSYELRADHVGAGNRWIGRVLSMVFWLALGNGIVLIANKSLHLESSTGGSSHRSISIEWY